MEKVRERGSVGPQPFAAWDGAAMPCPSQAAAASPQGPHRSAWFIPASPELVCQVLATGTGPPEVFDRLGEAGYVLGSGGGCGGVVQDSRT